MKKLTSILILIFFQITLLNAQEKDIIKLEQTYNSGDYDKCIELSQKTTKKYPNIAEPYVYSSFSNFKLYVSATKLRKTSYMNLTINNLLNAVKKDITIINSPKLKENSNIIHDSILQFAKNLWITDKSRSEYYFKSLATIYNDTTAEYRDIFEPKVVQITQNLAFKEYSGEINQQDMSGNRQGLWVEKYPNGIVKYEIFFKDNHPAGVYRKYYDNGNLKAKMYFNEKGNEASAILYNPDGSKYSMGYYKNKKQDSLWQYFYGDTLVISEVNYKNGIKNGPEFVFSTVSYPNILQEKYWKNGIQDSVWARYYPDGTPQFITQFKNGKRNGTYLAYNVDGKAIVSGTYLNDVSEGLWKYWNEDDNNYIVVEYKNGVPKNSDKFTKEQTEKIKQMEDMKGKFQEPNEEIYNKYDANNN